MDKRIKELSGANMDIDLISNAADIDWKQAMCPWNKDENTNEHKCAVKNTSICQFFCGIKCLDNVLCSYPHDRHEVFDNDDKE